MWRLFRWNLLKKFPDLKFDFKKIDNTTYQVEIPTKNISIRLHYEPGLTKNSDMFDLLLNSLISDIKNQVFEVKRKKKFLRR